ncbi:MAG: hypothetical protein EBZ75_14740 [Oxalobacteraceae bacterium]|nr:hypothetical protein [Oxalobacteraceae bacterium]
MKKLVWVAGLFLALSVAFPHGLPLKPLVSKPDAVVPTATPDPTIVKLLTGADVEDKNRIVSVYSGLLNVLSRAATPQLMSNTEKWELVQQNTLTVAIDKVGKYPGLDEAIESVFAKAVGTDDVVPVTPEVVKQLSDACEIIISSVNAAQ